MACGSCGKNECTCDCGTVVLPNQIESASINASNELLLVLDDCTTINAGALPTLCCATTLYNDVTNTTSTAAAFTSIKSYTVAANTLTSNGDYLKISAWVETNDTTSQAWHNCQVRINGSWYTTQLSPNVNSPIEFGNAASAAFIEIYMTRTANTTAHIMTKYARYEPPLMERALMVVDPSIAGFNFTGASFLIDVQVQTPTGAETITCRQLKVEFFQI